MNIKTYNKMYESISLIDFGNNKILKSNKVTLVPIEVREFIENKILEDQSRGRILQEDIDMAKKISTENYKSLVSPTSLNELKLIINLAYKYFGDTGNYNWINTSNITSFCGLFMDPNGKFKNFNGDIRFWNTDKVENMNYTFTYCLSFNQDLSNWNWSNVKYISGCFIGCNNEFTNHVKSLIDFSKIKTKFNIFN